MKRIRIITALLCLVPVWMMAQTGNNTVSCRVKGVLKDSLTLSGEEYATGRVYKKEIPDKMDKAFVTQSGGKFEFRITETGEYVLRLSSVGKRDAVKEFSIKAADKTVDLGTLFVTETDQVMNEVVVSALKPLVKMEVDRMEYDVEQDPESKTDNLIEMLRKVPLVTVDAEDNIEVNGSTKFKVHINGKPNNMITNNPKEVLRSMPASSIKKIEVITNPGSRYDAEGVTGILNIITMGSAMQGYTLSLNAGVTNTGVNGGLYTTVQKGKFTTTVRYNYNYNDPPSGSSEQERTTFNSEDNYNLRSENSYSNYGNNHNGGIEASYEIDTLRLLTLSGDFYLGDGAFNQWASTEMKNRQGGRTYFYNTGGRSGYDYMWIGGNIDYQRTFKRNKEELLTLSYRLGGFSQDMDYRNDFSNVETSIPIGETPISYLTNLRSETDRANTEHSFQVDYTNPFTQMHQIETGLKYILRINSSDGDYYSAPLGSLDYQPDESRSSEYDYNQDILAAYLSYRLKWNDFSAKVGARYEHTFQKVEFHKEGHGDFDVDFDDVVPSVLLAYKLSNTSNLRLSYDMRISRPDIWYLDPYVNRDDPVNISYGNPELDTEKSHSFNLSYSRSSQKLYLNLSAYYSLVDNSIERYSFLRSDTLHTTYGNVGKSSNTGLSLYFNWNATKSTRIYANSSFSYTDLESDEMDLHSHGFRFNGNGGIQQTLPGEIRLSVNGGGSTRRVTLQGRGNGYYYYGASLSREFLSKRLTVSLRANNFFHPRQTYSGYTETADFRNSYSNRNYRMSYGINVSYRLGELKAAVKKAQRTIQNDDVKSGGGGAPGGGE